MTIQFNQISSTDRTPGVSSEFNASRAVSALGLTRQMLVIGQRLTAGTVAEGVVFEVTSLDLAKTAAGVGSHFADTIETLLKNNSNMRVRGILLDDNGAGVAAVKTITVTGTATSSATLTVYVGGRTVQIAVTSGDVQNTIAANIEAALDADTNLLFSASVATNVVTLTAKHKGEWTEAIQIAVNPFTPELGGNQTLPAGVTFALADGATGSGNPAISTAISVIPDEVFNYILQPYNDDSNMDLMDTELTSRQDASRQLEGHAFNALAGTLSDSTTFGASRNSQYSTTIHAGDTSLSPEHQWAAAYIGKASRIAGNDPARPWHFIKLEGIIAEAEDKRLTRTERNTQLSAGVATHTIQQDGSVLIERGITNYQTNSLSIADTSFLDSQTSLTLSDLRQTFLQRMITRYFSQGFKLEKDGGNIPRGSNKVSPSLIRGEIISLAQDWVDLGLVESGAIAQFKTDLVVEINISDPNRVDVQMSPDIVNQLRRIANKILFIL